MPVENKVALLINYIKSLPDFNIVAPDIPYYHMGATIADAMLQAGVTWETVVSPRIQRLRQNHPDAKTTREFLELLEHIGARELLEWDHPEKPNRVLGVTRFFVKEGVETEADLREWIENHTNITRLKRLRGIGNKTADYFKILAGISTSAVDRHLIEFLNRAGIDIEIKNYSAAREIINKTADRMKIKKSVLDHSIWKYMSTGKRIRPCTK